MSHFSVLVAVPGIEKGEDLQSAVSSALDDILAPYCESTEDAAFLEFRDCEDEYRAEYENKSTGAVLFPDGKAYSVYENEVQKRFCFQDGELAVSEYHSAEYTDEELEQLLHEVEYIESYPFNKLYATFDSFVEDWHGITNCNLYHRYGYFTNPNATWDWFQIGGRWPGSFLVCSDTTEIVYSEDEGEESLVPGFISCSGARKKDICWDKLKKLEQDELRDKYRELCEIAIGKKEPAGQMHVKDGNVYGWTEFPLLISGETEAEYLTRNRCGENDIWVPGCYAFVDTDGEWHGQGDMGWWGISTNDKPELEWNAECRQFLEDVHEDTVLVMVDCHI